MGIKGTLDHSISFSLALGLLLILVHPLHLFAQPRISLHSGTRAPVSHHCDTPEHSGPTPQQGICCLISTGEADLSTTFPYHPVSLESPRFTDSLEPSKILMAEILPFPFQNINYPLEHIRMNC